jgi:hypothetical protein
VQALNADADADADAAWGAQLGPALTEAAAAAC